MAVTPSYHLFVQRIFQYQYNPSINWGSPIDRNPQMLTTQNTFGTAMNHIYIYDVSKAWLGPWRPESCGTMLVESYTRYINSSMRVYIYIYVYLYKYNCTLYYLILGASFSSCWFETLPIHKKHVHSDFPSKWSQQRKHHVCVSITYQMTFSMYSLCAPILLTDV